MVHGMCHCLCIDPNPNLNPSPPPLQGDRFIICEELLALDRCKLGREAIRTRKSRSDGASLAMKDSLRRLIGGVGEV